jgi:hypothetical protein
MEKGIDLHLKVVDGTTFPKSNNVRLKIWKYALCIAFKLIYNYEN